MPEVAARLHSGPPVRRVAMLPVRPRWIASVVHRMDLSIGEWAALSVSAVAAVPVAGAMSLVAGRALAAIVGLLLLAIPVGAAIRYRNRRDDRFVAGLPASIELIARALRTGRSLRQGLEVAAAGVPGPTTDAFAEISRLAALGVPIDRALAGLDDRSSAPETQSIAALLAMVAAGSGSGAAAIEAGARSLRERDAMRHQVSALVAQSETSMRVIAALPIMFVGLGALSGQSGATTLFTTPFGRSCLVAGVGLELAGSWWMAALVRKTVR